MATDRDGERITEARQRLSASALLGEVESRIGTLGAFGWPNSVVNRRKYIVKRRCWRRELLNAVSPGRYEGRSRDLDPRVHVDLRRDIGLQVPFPAPALLAPFPRRRW